MNNDSNLQKSKYDLEERTSTFAINTVILLKKLPQNLITIPLINQLVRSASSVGANYCEADNAESKKDFKHKIAICKKEAKECKHFIKIIKAVLPEYEIELDNLLKESTELTLIFNSIYNKVNRI